MNQPHGLKSQGSHEVGKKTFLPYPSTWLHITSTSYSDWPKPKDACWEHPRQNKIYSKVHTDYYQSIWAASAILCQIINLIQNFWFSRYLYISENFSICVIYLIKSTSISNIFHCVLCSDEWNSIPKICCHYFLPGLIIALPKNSLLTYWMQKSPFNY
jgi:hypothetical protein